MKSYPNWNAFDAFEKNLTSALARMDSARLGQPVYEVMRWPNGRVRGGKTTLTQAADYSPDICRFIDQATSLIEVGEVADWIGALHTRYLGPALAALHLNCGLEESSAECMEVFGISRTLYDLIRVAQKREREFRFLSDFALICARVREGRWVTSNSSLSRLESYEGARLALLKEVQSISQDRYIVRRLSPQDRACFEMLRRLLGGLQLSLNVVAPDRVRLLPYKRFHADGRGMRMEVAVEIFLLCRQCFGQCPKSVLQTLLSISDLDLPEKFDDWLADVIDAGDMLGSAFEQARILLNPLLPLGKR